MKYFLILVAALSLQYKSPCKIAISTLASISPLGMQIQDSGWISLFNGETLNGWHTFGDTFADSAWHVENGAIHLDASKIDNDENTINGGDLLTDEQYSNFDLKLQWKISKAGNSGIKFYVQEDTTRYDEAIGIEMQVVDNVNHDDGKKAKHRAGSLYDLIAPTAEVTKPYGEWNDAEIICNNGALEFYLNETKIVSAVLWNDDWKKVIAHSKFKRMKDWGTFKTGHIALQDHGSDVWYNNIMIKKLK